MSRGEQAWPCAPVRERCTSSRGPTSYLHVYTRSFSHSPPSSLTCSPTSSLCEQARPYTFEQIPNKPELTVKIAVPHGTRTKHVDVRITTTTLRVAVAGHVRQPEVVDGAFPHPVRSSILSLPFAPIACSGRVTDRPPRGTRALTRCGTRGLTRCGRDPAPRLEGPTTLSVDPTRVPGEPAPLASAFWHPPPPTPRVERQVDASASNWHLEGSGSKRTLVLDIEKQQAGLEWAGLLVA